MKVLKSLMAAVVTVAVVLPTNVLANWSNYPWDYAPWVHGGNWWGPDAVGNMIAQLLPFI